MEADLMTLPWHSNSEEEGDFPWDHHEEEEEELSPESSSPKDMDSNDFLDEIDEDLSRWLIAPYVDFTEIPAWQKAHCYALRVAELLREMDPRVLKHPVLIDLRGQSYLVAVDIAYGHDEGYGLGERQINLQRCKRSMGRLHRCLALIDALQSLQAIPPEIYRELFDRTIEVRDSLVHWMEEVRHV